MPDRNYNTGDGLTAVDPDKYQRERLHISVEASAKPPFAIDLRTAVGINQLAMWIADAGIPLSASFYFDNPNSTGGRFVWSEKR